jgi:hypothetical protein
MADVPKLSSRVTSFLEKRQTAARARLAFIIDATGSRQPTWDASARLQSEMFAAAAGLGNLEIQLVYFRGMAGFGGECRSSPWLSDGPALTRLMSKITCQTGETQIVRVLEHVRKEHQRQPINAVIYVGDMCEEVDDAVCGAARALGVPCFVFHEGNDDYATGIFQSMARLTKGAYCLFESGAEHVLRELLRAVVAYALGGEKALVDQRTDSARKLLGQIKRDKS